MGNPEVVDIRRSSEPGPAGLWAQPGQAEPGEQCLLSVVVPTRNEAPNIEPLVARLEASLASMAPWEAIFVDDSDDGTPSAISRQAARGAPVRLLHRPRGARPGGLGGAVSAGFAASSGSLLAVMDADLQHPPEILPALTAPLRSGEADLVAGSRYGWAGSDAGLSGPWRHLVSASCRKAVHALLPASRSIDDPLSGLFALRRSLLDEVVLRPTGYKILLEVVVRAKPPLVVNVGFRFAPRYAGTSKANLKEGMVFLEHLARLVAAHRGLGGPTAPKGPGPAWSPEALPRTAGSASSRPRGR